MKGSHAVKALVDSPPSKSAGMLDRGAGVSAVVAEQDHDAACVRNDSASVAGKQSHACSARRRSPYTGHRARLKFKPGNRRQEGSRADLTGGSSSAWPGAQAGLKARLSPAFRSWLLTEHLESPLRERT
jgi:hypothetical protein